jgi:hypothetical protein
MKTLYLSFPRLNLSLTAPDEIVSDIQAAFLHSIDSNTHLSLHCKYEIKPIPHGLDLLKNGRKIGHFGSCLDLICHLEEDIENTLIRAMGDWVGFHAGAVMIRNAACVIPGNPDTGKTTTTFNLVEMGHPFLCEEVSPVDPETLLVYPYPQVLTLEAAYGEKYRSRYPVQYGILKIFDSRMARYHPDTAGSDPVPLKTILMPAYDPSQIPGIEKLSPGEMFTELLGYCFPPNGDDEQLFDSVIRICEAAEIFRLKTNSLHTTRELLKSLFDLNPEPLNFKL